MSQATSTGLLIALRDEKDQQGWELFCLRYLPILVAFGRRLGLSEEDARDAAQDTLLAFVTAYREGKYERDKGRLRSWLLGIAKNKILYLQRRQARVVQPQDPPDQTGFFDRQPDDHSISEAWEQQWREAILAACIQAIRQEFEPRTVEAFELITLKEMPTEEAAERLGMTANALLKANRRVLTRMRQLHERLKQDF